MKEGEHTYSVAESIDTYEIDHEQFLNDLQCSVVIDVQGKNYYITVKTETKVKFECNRCLNDFFRPYSVETKIIYTEDSTLDPEHRQDGLYFLPAGQNTVDFTEDIRQSLLLELPMKMLCSESCKGLCVKCGVNLNVEECRCAHEETDPRWNALKNLRSETPKISK